jgi:hypothetical protein
MHPEKAGREAGRHAPDMTGKTALVCAGTTPVTGQLQAGAQSLCSAVFLPWQHFIGHGSAVAIVDGTTTFAGASGPRASEANMARSGTTFTRST